MLDFSQFPNWRLTVTTLTVVGPPFQFADMKAWDVHPVIVVRGRSARHQICLIVDHWTTDAEDALRQMLRDCDLSSE